MPTKVGVWIDHRKAVVVVVTEEGEEIGLIISKVEEQLRRSGDSPLKGSFEAQRVPADDRRQRALTQYLNIYYDAVISCIREADSILIFGPGEAKNELEKRLEKNNIDDIDKDLDKEEAEEKKAKEEAATTQDDQENTAEIEDEREETGTEEESKPAKDTKEADKK